jgi:hypothetical protein
MVCPTSPNQIAIDESHFWDTDGIHWSTHRIGWAISGGCAALTTIIAAITVLQHCRSYTVPTQQRQILRILYMPPVYAIISFFSYRFYRNYIYYSFIEVAYEAVTLSAFLLLIIDYVAETASGRSTNKALERKDKQALPFPFCFWRYRPTKAYFMYTVKWSVLQYIIIRPGASIIGIICEAMDILCPNDSYSWRYASVYIDSAVFISISIALYGLLIFYGLVKEELEGRRPLAKFLSIKLIVMFTFYQSFVISALKLNVLKGNSFWTEDNIKDGLDAILICIEMVFFSALMWWAYSPREYRKPGAPRTGIWRPILDSINYADFASEIAGSLRFFFNYARGKPSAHGYEHRTENDVTGPRNKANFGQAFAVSGDHVTAPLYQRQDGSESIIMQPYPFAHNSQNQR